MIELPNLGAFCEGLERWIEEQELLAEKVHRGLAIRAFKYVVQGTPEWTGNMAASWQLTVGTPSTAYNETPFKTEGWRRLSAPGTSTPEPYSRRNPNLAAFQYAYAHAAAEINQVGRLDQSYYLTNNTPYGPLRDTDSKVRVVNTPVEMANRARDNLAAYGHLTWPQALELAAEHF